VRKGNLEALFPRVRSSHEQALPDSISLVDAAVRADAMLRFIPLRKRPARFAIYRSGAFEASAVWKKPLAVTG
jgi:hypothetical protein